MPADRRSERSSSAHGDEIAELRRQVAAHERALASLRSDVAALRNELMNGSSVAPSGFGPGTAVARESARVTEPVVVVSPGSASVTHESSAEAKIALFRKLFAGRDDVYAPLAERIEGNEWLVSRPPWELEHAAWPTPVPAVDR